MKKAAFRINAVAPTRICDVGGWTDTWFAGHGAILNIAVYPYVEVQVEPAAAAAGGPRIELRVENFGHRYSLDPAHITYDQHPLIEAALDAVRLPRGRSLRITIFSDAPPGASIGTSAAVSVALVGALDALTPGRMAVHEAAATAHSIETDRLGLQCGVQDQLASAYGGINFIEVRKFPFASVSPLPLPDPIWWELEHRLSLIYIGTPHSSSETHRMVIQSLGEAPERDVRLEELRRLAVRARDALCAGDFRKFGAVLDANTEVQRRLHPRLVCPRFEDVIRIARQHGAAGCKVNGAGGDGGSVTVLGNGDRSRQREMLRALDEAGFATLPVYLSRRGLRVWKTAG